MPLSDYNKKRDFSKTPEPAGNDKLEIKQAIFVIQEHHASRLHYDFRLKIGSTLKSWAIPKGPSINPKDKRLAVETEDHPLAYADFEGIIPKGQYGGGVVLIWDKGTFENMTEKKSKPVGLEQAYTDGHIFFELYGTKLKGKFILQKLKSAEKPAWLLIKVDDEYASDTIDIIHEKPKSIISGLSFKEFLEKYHK